MSDIRPTWATRELPILRVALREIDSGKPYVDLELVRTETGLPVPQLDAGLKALDDAGYIEVSYLSGWTDDHASGHIDGVSERTRRELGSWPSAPGLVDDLTAALEAAADAETDPDRRSRLRAVADGLAGFARDLAVQVIAQQVGSF